MPVQDLINSLKSNDISTLDLQTILNTIYAQLPFSKPDELLLSSVLLDKVLPQTYALMDKCTRYVIYELLTTQVGLSQLIRLIHQGSDPSIVSIKNTCLYIDILMNILHNKLDILIALLLDSTSIELELWKSLVTVKLMDCLGNILIWMMDYPNAFDEVNLEVDRSIVKLEMVKYTSNLTLMILNKAEYIKDCSIEQSQCIRYILTYFLIKEPESISNIVLDHFEKCFDLFLNVDSKTTKQKFQFMESQKKFIFGIINLVKHRINESNLSYYDLWFGLIKYLSEKINFQNFKLDILNLCENDSNIVTSFLCMKCLENPGIEYVNALLTKFGTKNYILNTSITIQVNNTKFIIMVLSMLTNDQIFQISSAPSFLNTVTSRLESKVQTARELGMIVADYIYDRINGKNMFTILKYSSKRDAFMKIFKVLECEHEKIENDLSIDSILKNIKKSESFGSSLLYTPEKDLPIMETTPVIVDMDYDSDNEDSDLDDPSVGRRPNVAKPVFLKDLLHYLTSRSETDSTSYDKKSIAFSIAIEMVRIKKGTPEMKFYCTKLLDAAMDLDNFGFPLHPNEKFDDEQVNVAFDSWKLSFMVAICISEPDVSFDYLLKNFIKQDWSIPVRIQVLSCIGLSCRELCGKDDSFIWGKTNLDKVRPQKLSGPGHEAFLNFDQFHSNKKIVDFEQEEREQKLVKALESVDINDGKLIRKSRKLDLDRSNKEAGLLGTKTINTTFINKKLPKIYFSIAALWQEVNVQTLGNGFNVGSMSEYLNSHYLDILSIIYRCGVPSCVELIDMTIEEISIIISQLRSIQIRKDSTFPVSLFKSLVNSIQNVFADNGRTVAVLQSTATMELTSLFETYTQVLSDSPPLEEPTRTMAMGILQQLQSQSLYQ